MPNALIGQFLRRTLIAGGAAAALFAGFTALPAFTHQADAQEITPGPVAAPNGAPASFADLIERVRPAVVSISVRQRPDAARGPATEGLPPGFEEFFRGRPGRPGP
ncbi:MAG: hypothetical protein JNK94_09830, partial [Hyphomonadaceae bacterium]|nr:hypothetical protein [Hyphomonadaceae bacterium]